MSDLIQKIAAVKGPVTRLLKLVRLVDGVLVDANGDAIATESVTYSQFMDAGFDVATARFVHVNNKHSSRDPSVTAGSLWRTDPAAASTRKRVLISDPIYSATLDVALDPTLHPGVKCYIASFQDDVVSNGTRYDICGEFVVLKNLGAQVSTSASLETEWYPISVEIPKDVNGKSLLQDYGYISFHNIWLNKVGTTDQLRALVRFGTNNSSADLAVVDASSTQTTRWLRFMELKRTSATTIQYRGDGSTVIASGPTSGTHSVDSTVNNMDSTATYINVGARLTKTGGSVVDTSIVIRDCEIRLHKPGAA